MKQRRVVTFSADPIRQALVKVGQGARQLVEKRFGPRPIEVVERAVTHLRRTATPAAGKFYQWCEAAPAAEPRKRKRKVTDETNA